MRFVEMVRGIGLGGVGLVCTLAALICLFLDPHAALMGWLAAAVFLQAVPFGALVLLAVMRLAHGKWETDLRGATEAAAGVWFLSALTFIPVLVGSGFIFEGGPWGGIVPFVAGTILWFIMLAAIARSQVGGRCSKGASVIALIVLVLGGSLLAVDWFMSLEVEFQTSGYTLQVLLLEICVAYLAILLLRLTRRPEPQYTGALGAVLLLCLMLWFLFQFLPHLLIWADILPDSAGWYAVRAEGIWVWIVAAIGILGIGPMLALLLPQVRRSPRALALAGFPALVGKGLEFVWFAVPGNGLPALLAYLFALCGFGCFAASYLAPGTAWYLPKGKAAV
ncbi:hypothetical protein LK12_15545 [Novosphingobium malaysiense]|uniref:Uncharacterized protein n=2 Tax=Novosphingobium malaysiense TaxID=1348853 RepID=A0A0B1ZN48_9SPHN|nr:hypothetical protein LK12_15545 [Novosphingobium malaysiense]